MMIEVSINVVIVPIGFVTQNDKNVEGERVNHRCFQLGG
jgi:hypothetical protein